LSIERNPFGYVGVVAVLLSSDVEVSDTEGGAVLDVVCSAAGLDEEADPSVYDGCAIVDAEPADAVPS